MEFRELQPSPVPKKFVTVSDSWQAVTSSEERSTLEQQDVEKVPPELRPGKPGIGTISRQLSLGHMMTSRAFAPEGDATKGRYGSTETWLPSYRSTWARQPLDLNSLVSMVFCCFGDRGSSPYVVWDGLELTGPGCPQTHGRSSASVSWVLELQACVAMPSSSLVSLLRVASQSIPR